MRYNRPMLLRLLKSLFPPRVPRPNEPQPKRARVVDRHMPEYSDEPSQAEANAFDKRDPNDFWRI